MGIAFDLKLNSSNDITIGDDGDLTLTTTRTEMCAQTLTITLNTFQGEWFLDTSFGIPYIQEIIGVARKKSIADRIFLSAIADNAYVDSIESYTSTYDRDERYYTMTVTVTTSEGTVSTSFNTRPAAEYYYPTPSTGSTVTCSKYTMEPYAGELYYFENMDGLPLTTYSTWWNEWSDNIISTTQLGLVTQSGEYITNQDGEILEARTT